MRKKKIIAIVLAAVLVAAGLGSFAYANPDPVNKVSALFSTQWYYDVPGDTFLNEKVEGHEDFFAQIENDPDDTTADVTALTLTLDTETEFNFFQEENLVSPEPPYEYKWYFGDVPEGLGPVAWVGFTGPTQPLVSLTPGFDASRSLSETEFSAPGTHTQTLTITLTPRKKGVVTEGWLHIGVGVHENDLVDAVITSPTGGNGHRLDIHPTGLEVGTTYTYYITIEVTPEVPKVEFMPFVAITWWEPPSDSGTISGSSLSYTAPGAGTWKWSAVGSYEWEWTYNMVRGLQWHPCCREIAVHEPMTGQKLVGQGAYADVLMPDETIYDMGTSFTFTNPDCVGEITIDRISIFRFDGTVIYEGPLLRSGDGVVVETPWMEPMRPHETRIIRLDEMVPYAFPDWMEALESENEMNYTVEIFWSGATEGLPLTGWASTSIVKREYPSREVIDIIAGFATQMVNMEQVLEP